MLADDYRSTVETLVALGAPLAGWDPHERLPAETALANALRFASSDATLLRTLPVVLARNWKSLDWARLEASAHADGTLDRLGLVTELAGALGKLPSLTASAAKWWAPPRQVTYFFSVKNIFDKELADLRTPPVARRWGFLMNLGEDSFRTLFERHVGGARP